MGNTFYFEWEVKLMEGLQSVFGSGIFVKIFSLITLMGEELVCIAVLGFLYWGYNKEMGKKLATNIMVALVLNPLVKNIFLRRRPYFDNPGIKILKPVDADADIYDIAAQGYSFPSGHSTNSATLFGSLANLGKKKYLMVLGVVLPLLVGTSRFVLGAHYPTDVFVGLLMGYGVVFFVPFIERKIKNKYVMYAVFLIIGLPGFFYCTSNDYYTAYGIMVGGFASFIFDEKVVNFEGSSSLVRCIIRTVVGGALYVSLNTLLKLPFDSEFLASATTAAFLVRTVRYAIVIFAVVGVYPMVFKYTSKIGKKA